MKFAPTVLCWRENIPEMLRPTTHQITKSIKELKITSFKRGVPRDQDRNIIFTLSHRGTSNKSRTMLFCSKFSDIVQELPLKRVIA
ncbi:hypothetical protein M7I_7724 [Glarea lozoyensis 74030]|uniref:Uncharacterized protein n=1 Tax=Glarea lozoyensis (strain ATCC 74030 / MF5533) TaxID=1104152 RepID=H0EY27_GLAL7|nr:hypothetical protein M7I_7724 [Glarea lozoyensis 74030]